MAARIEAVEAHKKHEQSVGGWGGEDEGSYCTKWSLDSSGDDRKKIEGRKIHNHSLVRTTSLSARDAVVTTKAHPGTVVTAKCGGKGRTRHSRPGSATLPKG